MELGAKWFDTVQGKKGTLINVCVCERERDRERERQRDSTVPEYNACLKCHDIHREARTNVTVLHSTTHTHTYTHTHSTHTHTHAHTHTHTHTVYIRTLCWIITSEPFSKISDCLLDVFLYKETENELFPPTTRTQTEAHTNTVWQTQCGGKPNYS